MKWSDEQASQLRELCLAEKSNTEIAFTLGVTLTDVHAKRSQLGITIPKIGALKGKPVMTVNHDFEKAAQNMDDALSQKIFFWTLDQILRSADKSINSVVLTSEGKTVTITYRNRTAKIVNIEGDSLLAIIADVTRKCMN